MATFELTESDTEAEHRMWALIWGAYGAWLLAIAGGIIAACGWLVRLVMP